MFTTLPESRPRTERSLMQALASLTFHAGLIMGAVHVTQGAAAMVERRLMDTNAVYVQPLASTPPVTAPHATSAPTPAPIVQPTFATIAPPTEIPIGIPPVDIGEAGDPSRFTTLGNGSPASAIGIPGNTPSDLAVYRERFTADQVDVPVSYLGGGEPVYPTALKQAGLSGSVTLQFVVDTAGRVEPASVRVMPRSTAAFEAAAREAILRARFAPASVRGRAVRQLVQQRIVFEVGR